MNKTKIYTVIRALIFSLICLAGVLVLGQGFIPNGSDTKLANMNCGRYYRLEKNSLDVLAVGASTMKDGYSPNVIYENTGIVSYVRSTSAMPPSLFSYSVKEGLKSQNPAVVVVDAGQLFKKYDYSDEGTRMTFGANMDFCRLSVDKLRAAITVSRIAEEESVTDNLFPMLHYHNNWKKVSYSEFRKALRADYDPLLGQTPYFAVKPQKSLLGHMDIANDSAPKSFDEDALASYNELIEICKKRDIKVLLFRAPRHDWLRSSSETIQKYADSMGVDYLDMNTDEILKETGIDESTDFINSHHLNYNGAEKMSTYLGNYLLSHYDIDVTDTTPTVAKRMQKNLKEYRKYIEKNRKK